MLGYVAGRNRADGYCGGTTRGPTMNITSVMGTALIVVGICLVVFETIKANKSGQYRAPNVADFSVARWRFRTAYPGITMICIGALLLGVGTFARH
jgi:hypothetical protein